MDSKQYVDFDRDIFDNEYFQKVSDRLVAAIIAPTFKALGVSMKIIADNLPQVTHEDKLAEARSRSRKDVQSKRKDLFKNNRRNFTPRS